MYKFGLQLDPALQKNQEVNSPFLAVRVVKTILDSSDPDWEKYGGWDSLGMIKFVPLYSDVKSNTDSINVAKPLYPNVKHYPLETEITYVIQLPDPGTAKDSKLSSFYYFNTINLWNHPHHNAFPDINPNTLPESQKIEYKEVETGLEKKSTEETTTFKLGNTFKEKGNIKPLLPFEGDIIREGRWGQSIRFGSTVNGKTPWSNSGNNGDPITIIRNGQAKNSDQRGWIPTIEDINEDGASFYLTENQVIPIKVASKNLGSFGRKIEDSKFPVISVPDNDPTPNSASAASADSNLPSSDSPTSFSIPVPSNTNPVVNIPADPDKVYDEEEVIFHFPGEDNTEFIFDLDSIEEEESNSIEVQTEKYDSTIIANESTDTKSGDNYAVYRNGVAEYAPISYLEGVRMVVKYISFVKLLLADARKAGIALKVRSGFRTWDEQVAFRKKHLKDKTKLKDIKYLNEAASSAFKPLTAKPGYSNHQKGTAFDFNTENITIYRWMFKNAQKYGFVRTVKTERWHWEYIPNTDKYAYVPKDHSSWEGLI